MRAAAIAAAGLIALLGTAATAEAQTAPAVSTRPAVGSRLWFVFGPGFTVARAGCPLCDRAGVFTNSRGLLLDAGFRITPKVDAGLELSWVSSRLEDGAAPIRTTFILGIGQLRPWDEHGFFIKAGMGIGFIGNGLFSPLGPDLEPPFTTNTLALMYGIGWVVRRDRRVTYQLQGTQHVVALGELTNVSGTTVRNVVGNYWTAGAAIVIR